MVTDDYGVEKSRVNTFELGNITYYSNGSRGNSDDGGKTAFNETLLTFNHPGWTNPVGDTGGPFKHHVTRVIGGGANIQNTVPSGFYRGSKVSGIVFPCDALDLHNEWLVHALNVKEPVDSIMDADGASAIALVAPVNPTIDLSVSLGELRNEGLPKFGSDFIKARCRKYNKLGGDYLNYQFGWTPFVSDLRGAANNIRRSHTILNQYKRDAGKGIRRQFEYPLQETSSSELYHSSEGGNPLVSSIHLSSFGNLYRTSYVTTRKWFSGKFVYHIPYDPDQIQYQYMMAGKLLGLKLTPATVWNLSPWSWMADWFANTGDVISNISNYLFDNQVLKYGYMMQENAYRSVFELKGTKLNGGGSCDSTITLETVFQKRRPGNPFGFGLKFSDLSEKQLAILAALGISFTPL
jgi:hypothetical protein